MNFINHQHEDIPPGAAQTHEQPMVEKSIADGLVAELAALRAENATAQRYVSDANEEINALRAEVERLRELVTEIHPTVIECWMPAPLDSRLNGQYQSWAERALPMLKLQDDYDEGES